MSPYSRSPYTIKRSKSPTRKPLVWVLVIVGACFLLWLLFRAIVPKIRTSIPTLYPDVVGHVFHSKRALMSRVVELETTLNSYDARLSELSVLEQENALLKEEFGRTIDAERGVLAHVLTLPNRSFYETLIIDAGTEEGIVTGQTAYAFGTIALGTVSYTDSHTATVTLFSAPGREITGNAFGSNVSVTLIGRGGGEFEVRMPREVRFDIGSMITHQSVDTSVLAYIEKVASDPRDPFQRLYAKAPVNLQALKWVRIK